MNITLSQYLYTSSVIIFLPGHQTITAALAETLMYTEGNVKTANTGNASDFKSQLSVLLQKGCFLSHPCVTVSLDVKIIRIFFKNCETGLR